MTDITGELITIQQEEVDYRSAVSEGVLTRVGASINYLVANAVTQVGDIIPSMLTEAQFQSLRNTTWVLMDGRNVAGSDYATLTGNSTIPDARGTYLRSKDNSRGLDPAGDPALGTYQVDQLVAHRHFTVVDTLSSSANDEALSSINSIAKSNTNTADPDYTLRSRPDVGDPNPGIGRTSSTGPGSETRVKSTIINYFIKINN